MANAAVPGVLMRIVEPKESTQNSSLVVPQLGVPNIQATYTAAADDGVKPSRLALYVLDDITPLSASNQLYEDDLKTHPELTISWVVCRFVSGRDNGVSSTGAPSKTHPLPHQPAARSKLVINGSTPRSGKESDYHEWYDVEHGPGLATVPGWNSMRRYALEKVYGDVETANFYGFNYYDEESGLGGPIWQSSTKTEWTFRIRGNAAKPNIRRVWRIESS